MVDESPLPRVSVERMVLFAVMISEESVTKEFVLPFAVVNRYISEGVVLAIVSAVIVK
jgi:hypothetical protein